MYNEGVIEDRLTVCKAQAQYMYCSNYNYNSNCQWSYIVAYLLLGLQQ